MALAFPTSPTTGQIHTTAGRAWRWTGSRWARHDLAGSVVSANAPANPVPGMRWIHEDQGRAYEYLDSTWVELGGIGGGVTSYTDLTDRPTLGTAAATASSDYATTAQGAKADSALQPTPVNYLGEYNNGLSYNLGVVVKFNGSLYIRVSNPLNPGYPPGHSSWDLFDAEVGSPAYDLWVQNALDSKQAVGDYATAAQGATADTALQSGAAISEISGLQTALDGKQASGSYAPATGIEPSAITGTAVVTTDSRLSDARTPTSHNHDASNINAGTLANDRLPTRLQATAQTISDWNNALENGWYQGSQAANAPDGVLDWWLGYVEVHNALWVTQTVHRFTADAPENTHIWRRSSSDGGGFRVWNAWHKLQLSQAEQDARYQASGSYVVTTDSRLSDARTPLSHSHSVSDVTGLQTALDGKQASGSYVVTTDSRLSDARTPLSHSHSVSDVTGLQTALDGKQASGSYVVTTDSRLSDARAPLSHTHDDRYYTESEINLLLPKIYTKYQEETRMSGTLSPADITLPIANANIIQINISVTNVTSSSTIILKAGNSTAWLTSYDQSGARLAGSSLAQFMPPTTSLATNNASVSSIEIIATFFRTQGVNNTIKWNMIAQGTYNDASTFIGSADFTLENFDRIQIARLDGQSFRFGFSTTCFVI